MPLSGLGIPPVCSHLPCTFPLFITSLFHRCVQNDLCSSVGTCKVCKQDHGNHIRHRLPRADLARSLTYDPQGVDMP